MGVNLERPWEWFVVFCQAQKPERNRNPGTLEPWLLLGCKAGLIPVCSNYIYWFWYSCSYCDISIPYYIAGFLTQAIIRPIGQFTPRNQWFLGTPILWNPQNQDQGFFHSYYFSILLFISTNEWFSPWNGSFGANLDNKRVALETGMGDATSERIACWSNIHLTTRYFEVYTQGTRVNCTILASGGRRLPGDRAFLGS